MKAIISTGKKALERLAPSKGPSPAVSRASSPNPSATPADPGPQSQTEPQTDDVLRWEDWEIDQTFVQELVKWEKDNPKNRFGDLLAKINSAIDSEPVKALQDLIPNAPIPIKGLVRVLLSLVQLGIKISKAKRDVSEFVKTVIKDITDLQRIFGDDSGLWLEEVWVVALEDMRTTVNDILRWAYDELEKPRTSPPAEKITAWQNKLREAKDNFRTKLILAQNKAQDRVRETKEKIKTQLGNRIASKVLYTDQKKQFCHEGTRVEILGELQRWSENPSHPKHCFWITGRPGSGKSTLAATFAQQLNKNDMLCAQYFISRNDPETTKPERLFPTLSQQLANQSWLAARAICDGLKHADKLGVEQAEYLLLKPLKEIAKQRTEPAFVVIDALDEMERSSEVADIFHDLASKLPDNAKIVITSRSAKEAQTSEITNVISIHDLDPNASIKEVGKFIRDRMGEILKQKCKTDLENWKNWPTEGQLKKLSENAAGLFHYAETITQWIDSQLNNQRGRNIDQDKMLHQVESIKKKDLDELYSQVLEWEEGGKQWEEDFQQVTGCLIVLQSSQNIGQLTSLLGINSEEFNLLDFFHSMRSLFITGNDPLDDKTIPWMHKSFREYITSNRSPEGFHIEKHKAHLQIAKKCFQVLGRANKKDPAFSYAAKQCFYHQWKVIDQQGQTDKEVTFIAEMKLMLSDDVFKIWYMGDYWNSPRFINLCNIGWHWKKNDGESRKEELEELNHLVKKMKNAYLDKEREMREEEERIIIIGAMGAGIIRRIAIIENPRSLPYSQIWEVGLDVAYVKYNNN